MLIADPAALAVLTALGLAACWYDIKERRLPNTLVLATLAAGLGLAAWRGGAEVLPWHLAHLAVALGVGIGLYAIRALGAGDAKYYAALAAWFTLGDGLKLLMAVSFAGLVLALGWLAWRKFFGNSAPRKPIKDMDDMDKVPFGVAMATGAVLALLY
jgi:prepilin peptidase CpaA